MIGLIVTGHGNFASGLVSSLNLIAGSNEHIGVVDFPASYSSEDLEADLKQAIHNLKECDGLIILSDLMGGTPFKTSVVLTQGLENSAVVYGTNLPLLLEVAMIRTIEKDVNVLTENLIKSTRNQIGYFQPKEINNTEEDGI